MKTKLNGKFFLEGSKASHRLTFTIARTKQLYGSIGMVLLKREEPHKTTCPTGRTLFNNFLPRTLGSKAFLNFNRELWDCYKNG
ncbi:MAG: hypothetical protein AAF969_06670 [Bacteroidota bacterium]